MGETELSGLVRQLSRSLENLNARKVQMNGEIYDKGGKFRWLWILRIDFVFWIPGMVRILVSLVLAVSRLQIAFLSTTRMK